MGVTAPARSSSALHAARATPTPDAASRPGEPGDGFRRARLFWRFASIMAGLLGVASVLASLWVRATVAMSGQARLERAADRAASFLEARINAYSEILRGAGALFRSSEHVSRGEFRAYMDSLNVEKSYPGLFGLGYAERVPRARLDDWLRGLEGEGIRLNLATTGNAPELVINKLVEPLPRNRAAVGFDVASEPERAKALWAAARTGDLAITGRIELRQDPSRAPGFLLYLPLSSQRDELGPVNRWVFAAIREQNLVAQLERAAGAHVVVHVFDADGSGSMFGSALPDARLQHNVNVRFADRVLRLEARPGPGFYSLSERTEPWAILILGLAATALSFGLVRAWRGTEQKSRALALRMTGELRSANEALAEANQALERMATTDALTQIANRRVFDERLAEELARAQRNGTPLALAMLDIDHFKLYNDSYGHVQGDMCLRQVADCLRALTRRAGDLAARYGGEEFTLLLPGTDDEAARQLAEDLRAHIAALAIPHKKNESGVVTASIGVACYDPRSGQECAQLVAAADAALYRAKRAGRDRVEVAVSAPP